MVLGKPKNFKIAIADEHRRLTITPLLLAESRCSVMFSVAFLAAGCTHDSIDHRAQTLGDDD